MIRTRRVSRRLQRALPLVVLGGIALALLGLPLYSDENLTSFNVYNALQAFSSLGLLALAVGLTMIAGEFDLSTIGMYALGGMLAVQLGDPSPVLGIAAAILAGLIIGAIQGGIIARLRISSVPVTLGGYIAVLGLTSVISSGKSVAYERLEVGVWLEQVTATFFSPRSLIALAVFAAVAALLHWSRLGRDLRAVGGDRRAARAAGVKTDRVLVGTFMASAALSALGGGLLAYSIASANPDPGLTPFIFAVTAALLGGVTLAGGQGAVLGIAVGAISLALLQELFVILATPDYVSKLVLGGLLVLVVVVEAPDLRRAATAARARLRNSQGGDGGMKPLAASPNQKGP
jgi:ribose/xylose/arabinose/galactoside ABC-type transport system permease subunit